MATRKKPNGIKKLLEVIIEAAIAGLKIYQKAKPLVNGMKKKNGKRKKK